MQSDLRGREKSQKLYVDIFTIGVSAGAQMLVFELG